MRSSKLLMAAVSVALFTVSHAAFAQYGPPGMGQGYGPPPGYGPGGYNPSAYAPAGYMQPNAGIQPFDPGTAQPMGAPPGIPQPPASAYGCSSGMGGYGSCGDGCGDYCCGWTHRLNVFGEFLYLKPRDCEIAYASEIDGPVVAGAPGLQVDRIGVLDQDYQPGFRFGVGFTLDNCNALQVTYSQLDATSTDTVQADGNNNNVIKSLVIHPDSPNAGSSWLDAAATGNVRFQMLDVDYRGLLSCCSDYQVSYLVGVRYARFEQSFTADFTDVGTETVTAGVDFDGVGARFGMDFERYGRNQQWFVFGKGYASLIGGRFENNYLQGNQGDPIIVNTTWEAGRVITMLDLEAGLGWQSCSGNIRLSVGYLYSGWFNTIRMNEWIRAVQNNDYVATGMSTYDSGITFDGLTARVELLW